MEMRTNWNTTQTSPTNLFYTKDETVESVVDNFDIRRYNSAEGHSVFVGMLNQSEERVIIQDHSNPLNKDKVDKKMLIPMNSIIQTGTYITYRNELWLVCSQINIVDDAYKSCMILKSNWLLKWQNPITYDIITRQAVVLNASQYNSGVDENKTLTIGSNQYMIHIPYDKETLQLTYDMRLFIDNNYKIPYKITRPDNVSMSYNGNGLINLIMSQDQLNLETDNIELRICDYKEKPIIPINSIPIKYSGNSDIKIGNNYKTFTADTTDTVTWTVTSLITNLDVQIINNIIKIKCPFDYSYIGMTVTLKATSATSSGEIILKVVGVI